MNTLDVNEMSRKSHVTARSVLWRDIDKKMNDREEKCRACNTMLTE